MKEIKWCIAENKDIECGEWEYLIRDRELHRSKFENCFKVHHKDLQRNDDILDFMTEDFYDSVRNLWKSMRRGIDYC